MAFIPYKNDATNFDVPSAGAMPIASPPAAIAKTSRRTIRTTLPCHVVPPSAIRMPIFAGAAGDVVRHAAVETHAGDRQRQGYPQPDQMVYALRTSGDRTNTGYYATGGMSLVRPP